MSEDIGSKVLRMRVLQKVYFLVKQNNNCDSSFSLQQITR